MDVIDERLLPPPAAAGRVDAEGRAASGEPVPVRLTDEAVEIGDLSLPLDDTLRATLAWSRPDRERFILELRAVTSATSRLDAALSAPSDAVGELAGLPLVELAADRAVEVDGGTLRAVLGRVRAVLEANVAIPPVERWQPRGDLSRSSARMPLRLAPLSDAEVEALGLELVSSDETAHAIAIPGTGRVDPSHQRVQVAKVASAAGVVVLMVGFAGLVAAGVVSPSPLLAIVVVLAIVAASFGTRVLAARVPPQTVRITSSAIEGPDGECAERRGLTWIPVPTEGEPLRFVRRDGTIDRWSVGHHTNGVLYRALLVTAWELTPPTLGAVESPPGWARRLLDAHDDADDVVFAGGALWFGEVRVEPGRVTSATGEALERVWFHPSISRLDNPEGHRLGNGYPLPSNFARIANEVASPLRPSAFASSALDHWQVEVFGDNESLEVQERAGNGPDSARLSFRRERVSLGSLDCWQHRLATREVEIKGSRVRVGRAHDAPFEVRCGSADAAHELAALLGIWLRPDR